MTYKFVLFDMDGTITDTMRLQPAIIRKYLIGNKESFTSVQRKMASIYYHNKYTWFKLKTPIQLARIFQVSIFKMIMVLPIMVFQYWRALKRERIFEYTRELVTHLQDNGIIVGLATNGTDFEVKVKIPSISHIFPILVTSSDVKHKKPNPEMILKGIVKAKVKAEETLYVGDTIVDFLASTNAKTGFALMTTGTFGAEVVKIGDQKPKNIFNNLKELESFILKSH